jgi:hypothetical protein
MLPASNTVNTLSESELVDVLLHHIVHAIRAQLPADGLRRSTNTQRPEERANPVIGMPSRLQIGS